jgi:hypothetical protein
MEQLMNGYDGRLLAILSINLSLLDVLERKPTLENARRLDDMMFLPRSVDKIEAYLADASYPELRECMFLVDLVDTPADLQDSIHRIRAALTGRLEQLLSVANARALIFDWLP